MSGEVVFVGDAIENWAMYSDLIVIDCRVWGVFAVIAAEMLVVRRNYMMVRNDELSEAFSVDV